MHEVTKALTDVQASSVGESELALFQTAAEKWAVFALRNFTGEHVAKALDVSRAMAEYVTFQESLRK